MSINSAIEWTQRTWNCLVGCTKKSKGCMNCYAIRVAWRLMHNPNPKIAKKYEGTVAKDSAGNLNWTGRINFDEDALLLPLQWRKPSMIFVNSESDLFHKNVKDEWLDQIFAVMALCQQHTFQVLTKEPERMRAYMQAGRDRVVSYMLNKARAGVNGWADWIDGRAARHKCWIEKFDEHVGWPLSNLWAGVSVEDQKTADERISLLLQTPAAVRWISAEPLLSEVDLFDYLHHFRCDECGATDTESPGDSQAFEFCADDFISEVEGVDWVVCGGESGPGARPMHPDWVRKVRDDCVAAGVPFFFKQQGAWSTAKPSTFSRLSKNRWSHESVTFRADGSRYNPTQPGDLMLSDMVTMYRTNKHAAGRLLDGQEWNQFPLQEA